MSGKIAVKNRQVETPMRFRLVPVSGTTDIYNLVAVTGDVIEEGTPVNKALFDLLQNVTALGAGALVSQSSGVAIGDNAVSTANGAVQLGAGTNDTENTLKFRNTEIVDSEGKIVAANMLRYRTLIVNQYGTYYIPRQEIGEIVHIFVQFPLVETINFVTVKTATTPDCEYICIKQEKESAALSILKDQAQVFSIESSTTKRTSAHAIVIRCK